MAIWQFRLELIPHSWLEAGGDVASLFDADGFDPSSAWIEYEDQTLIARLNLLLPRAQSWHEECVSWGSDKTDDIQLWRESDHISSLSIRFDLRNLNVTLLKSVTHLAGDLGLALLVPSTRCVIAGDTNSLATFALASEAARFAQNPREFIAKLNIG